MKALMIISLGILFTSVGYADQTVDVKVTRKGFEPSKIKAKAGEKVTLNITREVKVTCAKDIVIPSLDIKKELPLNKSVTVEVTAKEKGEIAFGCTMDQMLGGMIEVI